MSNQPESFIDFENLIKNYKIENLTIFISYLKEVWVDLQKRNKENNKGIDKITFINYYKLPGIIVERLYCVFDSKHQGFIDLEDFLKNMQILFCSNYDKTTKFIFDFYDFDKDGFITKEDIRVVCSYISLQNKTSTENIKQTNNNFNYYDRVKSQEELQDILNSCFKDKEEKMDYKKFAETIEKINSDIYFLILIFLYENKPFTKIGLKEYENQKKFAFKISNKEEENNDAPKKFIRRPGRHQTFSSSINNVRAQMKKRTIISNFEKVKTTLFSRNSRKTKTLKMNQKLNLNFDVKKSMFNVDKNNNIENSYYNLNRNLFSPGSPNKIEIQRKPQQNLKEINFEKLTIVEQEKLKHTFKKKRTAIIPENYVITPAVKLDNVEIENTILKKLTNQGLSKRNKKEDENEDEEKIFDFESDDEEKNKKKKENKNDNIFNFDNNEEENEEQEDEEKVIKHEGYLYKQIDDNLKKIWFKLVHHDLYFFKNKFDKEHRGMHNLSGVFIESLPIIQKNDKTYYGFSLLFPGKRRDYFCDDESEYKLWIENLKVATNFTNLTDFYSIGPQIGQGKFGVIKICKNNLTGKKYALKILSKKEMDKTDLELVKTEIEILKVCQHPYIIKLYDLYENVDYYYIIQELCEGGDLFSYIEKRGFCLKESRAAEIVYKICKAVYYIHSYGIIHRDLKPENILMKDNTELSDIRIMDFGLSKILGPEERCTEPYGTLSYCAPEVLLEEPYNKEVDIWSIGVITYLLLSAQLPFNHRTSQSEIARQTIYDPPPYRGKIWNFISPEAKDFIDKCLKKKMDERINITQCLEHPWFKKYFNEFSENKNNDKTGTNFEKYSSPTIIEPNDDNEII